MASGAVSFDKPSVTRNELRLRMRRFATTSGMAACKSGGWLIKGRWVRWGLGLTHSDADKLEKFSGADLIGFGEGQWDGQLEGLRPTHLPLHNCEESRPMSW